MTRAVFILPVLLLAACAQPVETGEAVYDRTVEAPASDPNVYTFSLQGPNRVGTVAIGVTPTAGPDAAPGGALAGPQGRAKAEAAAVFYGENAVCDGGPFRLAPETVSRYDAASNTWTVFGRCTSA